MDAPKISIVIVNWNGKKDTLECLESLGRIDDPNVDVILVDNGSTDGSVDLIRGGFPGTAIIETGKNLGFAGGNNVGIREAMARGARFVFLLNNDTTVDAGILRHLREASRSINDKGILAAKIYLHSRPEVVWYAGGQWKSQRAAFEHVGMGRPDDDSGGGITETDYVCGCALFAPAEAFKEIGLFDERFFLTFEEADFCYRARAGGYRSFVVPEAKVWHKVSVSFGGAESSLMEYFKTRNRLLWAEKHLPASELVPLFRQAASELIRCTFPPLTSYRFARPSGRGFVATYLEAVRHKYSNPMIGARRRGVLDYCMRRFGDCPASIRRRRGAA